MLATLHDWLAALVDRSQSLFANTHLSTFLYASRLIAFSALQLDNLFRGTSLDGFADLVH